MTRRLLAVATAVLLMVGGGLVLGGYSGGSAGDDLADEPTTTTAQPRPLGEVVRALQAFVAETRGLEFKADVDVALLEDGPFQDRLLRDAEEDREDIEVTARIMQAVGLLDRDIDLYRVLTRFLGDAVVGFYDPQTDELVVRGGRLSPYRRATLVHELTHALDDQWFDLHRPELDEGENDERSLAFSALVEGDAVRVEGAYRDTLSRAERLQAQLEEQQLAGSIDLKDVPLAIPRIIAFPYINGPNFVRALLDEGGEELVNRTFERPPFTSEHILEPGSWIAGEKVVAVRRPPADGPVLDEGLYGRAGLELTLEAVIGTRDAGRAAAGWGGDRYVVWDGGGGRTCVRSTFVMDTAEELDELVRELRAWAAEVGADVEAAPDSVTFTSCS